MAEPNDPATPAAFASQHPRWLVATFGVTFVAMGATALFPLFAVVPGAGAVLPIALWVLARLHAWPRLPRSAMWAPLLAYVVFLAVNASWSAAPWASLIVVANITLFALVAVLTTGLFRHSETAVFNAMAAALAIVMGLLAVGLAIEVATGLGLRRGLASFLPSLVASDPDLVTVKDGYVVTMAGQMLNKNVSLFALLFWPGVAIGWALATTPVRRALLWGAGVIGIGATFGSQYDTAKVALVLSGLTFVAARHMPVWVARGVVAAWLSAAVLAVPIAKAAYRGELYNLAGMPYSWGDRIVIWGHTAEQVGRAPWLGVGIETTRTEHIANTAPRKVVSRQAFKVDTNLHAHDVFITSWYETGAVGMALLSVLVLAVVASIARQPAGRQPYAYATLVAIMTTASLSWSLWAAWFLASIGIAAIMLGMADTVTERASAAADRGDQSSCWTSENAPRNSPSR